MSNTTVLASDVQVVKRSNGLYYAECAGHEFVTRGYVAEHAADLMARQHEADCMHSVPETDLAALIAEAVELGNAAGYVHENYVTAYGDSGQRGDGTPEVPARFASVSDYWVSAYADGREAYREENEEI